MIKGENEIIERSRLRFFEATFIGEYKYIFNQDFLNRRIIRVKMLNKYPIIIGGITFRARVSNILRKITRYYLKNFRFG